MTFVIILALITSYLIGSSFLPPQPKRLNAGMFLAVVTVIASFAVLKWWGFLLVIGVITATLLVLLYRMASAFTKITRNVEVQVAKDKHLEEQKNEYADDPERLAQIEALKGETFRPGKASHVKNKKTKKAFTVSTLGREIELEYKDKDYSSTVESAVFVGTNTNVKPTITVQFLGGTQKDVAYAHKIVVNVVENELPSGFAIGGWWEEFLATKGLHGSVLTEYQPWYDDELTSVLVTKK